MEFDRNTGTADRRKAAHSVAAKGVIINAIMFVLGVLFTACLIGAGR